MLTRRTAWVAASPKGTIDTPSPPPIERHPMGSAHPLARRFVTCTLMVAALAGALVLPSRVEAQCIDEAIQDELNARRRYRGVEEWLFQKAGRHELSLMGGVYSADLLSSYALAQGAYTYHFTESLGLELSFSYTRSRSELIEIVEETTGST